MQPRSTAHSAGALKPAPRCRPRACKPQTGLLKPHARVHVRAHTRTHTHTPTHTHCMHMHPAVCRELRQEAHELAAQLEHEAALRDGAAEGAGSTPALTEGHLQHQRLMALQDIFTGGW